MTPFANIITPQMMPSIQANLFPCLSPRAQNIPIIPIQISSHKGFTIAMFMNPRALSSMVFTSNVERAHIFTPFSRIVLPLLMVNTVQPMKRTDKINITSQTFLPFSLVILLTPPDSFILNTGLVIEIYVGIPGPSFMTIVLLDYLSGVSNSIHANDRN